MSGWRKVAEELRHGQEGGDNRDIRDDRSAQEPLPPLADPLALVRGWREALDSLDAGRPLHGLDRARWRQLLDDADWLLENFGRQAACDGWTAGELFGVLPGKDGWGGIADRLRGSRSLVMTADRARWRMMHCEAVDQLNRGAYPDLRPLWEETDV